MKLKLLVVALAALVSGALFAQVRPMPGPGDPRVQTVDYDADQVVLLAVAPGYQTTLEFGSGERIETVSVGDSGAWQATPNRRGNHLFVKPVQPGLSTNMVVVTDARIYAFELTPLYGPSPDMAYTVRFRYPNPAAVAEVAPTEVIEARYRLSGARSLRPSRISDDGEHTYIAWGKNEALPAVFAVDDRGRETLVNGMVRDDIYVLDSVASRLVFRIDRHVARATRIAPRKAR